LVGESVAGISDRPCIPDVLPRRVVIRLVPINYAMVNLPAMEPNAALILVARWLIPDVQAKAIKAMSKAYSTKS
jgi:hypothetical protein